MYNFETCICFRHGAILTANAAKGQFGQFTDDRVIVVLFSASSKMFLSPHSVYTNFGAHPAFFVYRVLFPWE